MKRSGRGKRHGLRTIGALMAAVLTLAAGTTGASGGDGKSPGGKLTDSFRGVTAKTIKLGIVIIDYDSIKDFVDFHRGDQQETAQIFVDEINDNGGVGGRMIDPVFKTYVPIPGQEPGALSLCTSLTEDEKVFAVLGVFIDFSGDAQLCLTRDHKTIHIGHELEQPWIDASPPALLLTPENTKEKQAEALLNLFKAEGTLKGKKVAVIVDQDAKSRATDIVEPGLDDLGVKRGSTAVLTVTGTDTAQAQSQLDSFIERWKTEHVDTIFMVGLRVSGAQFVQKIKAALPKARLITDAEVTLEQAQDLQSAGTKPNPYEGMLGIEGKTESERWANKSPEHQKCVDVWEKATGKTLIGPDELKPGPDGRVAELFIAVEDFCGELLMFKTIAEKAGPNLTNRTWRKAVDTFGPIKLATTDLASLCKGKYGAKDEGRIVKYDSSIGDNGDWKAVSEIQDTSGGKCAKP
jgi:ABC-type branched-subunit amino acid transport system substrate-binding protein